MIFPASASVEEQNFNWSKIGEQSDQDFGITDLVDAPVSPKFGTRTILMNDKQEVCLVKSEKYGYLQIPGGGLEPGETIEQTLRRETQEETGYEILDYKPLGYFIENLKSVQHQGTHNQYIHFVFLARPGENVETNYMEDELAEDFRPVWLPLDEALVAFEKAARNAKSYKGIFSNNRDLKLLQFAMENQEGQQ